MREAVSGVIPLFVMMTFDIKNNGSSVEGPFNLKFV
jgi:hypothetical protein